MKALLLQHTAPISESPLELVEVAQPEPKFNEIRIKVSACGLCRTDLHVIEGDLEPKRSPIIPGHQIVGKVDKVGSSTQRFKVGDRVGIAWLRSTCQKCQFCRSGRENLCEESTYTGYHEHGGYAEFAVVPEEYAYSIPSSFKDEEAAPLLCAGIIGYRALKRSSLPQGGKLGLLGFGSSAHVTLQVARFLGAEVYVSTRGQKHQQFARDLGATWVGSSSEKFPILMDSIILFAPAGELVPYALRQLKKGGTLALAGIHLSQIPAFDYEPHIFHEKVLTSVEANTRSDGEELLSIASQIPLRPHVTTVKMAQINETLLQLANDGIDGTAVMVL